MIQDQLNIRPLKIMIATPGGRLGQGGIDRMMMSLHDELQKEAAQGGEPGCKVEATFVPTRGTGHIAFSPLYLLAFCIRMIFERLCGQLDVVHINLASEGSTYRKLIIAAFARLMKIPYVIHLHGAEYMIFWSDRDSFINRQIKMMFERAGGIIVLGRAWRDFVLRKAPAVSERVFIIPNATAAPDRAHVGGGDKVHIIFLGRVGERKGVPQLCEALADMKDMSGWKATIAGDGEVDWLRQHLRKLQLEDRVAVSGWQGPEEVGHLLSNADILALPSFAENLPVSVIEAMAEGLAIVATPVGAVEDIIKNEDNGLLIQPGDVAALRGALQRLLDDPLLRKRLGDCARQTHRQRLDLPHYVHDICSVWMSISQSAHDR
ncbi:glycosyltransferase family 4 protein [Rhizobium oryzicola]|uniref:Glycosyltransferase family 4 protein n=1 Tax=Rhizobium oryzicola TaxID=1232668 RepID=A0ABT8SWF4_9HYPH|nr:glycosyltransferase family 4 protein [Rhizobium oryzicola]MDO1582794.1 glycosyltransferase family 4 protein [Rhizobium oryzicola]